MEARKERLAGDTARQATFSEVTGLKREARDLKKGVAEQTLELRRFKKVCQRIGAAWKKICLTRQSLLAAMKVPHQRNWRSSGWARDRTCLSNAHRRSCACRGQLLSPALIDCDAINCRSTGYDRHLQRGEAGLDGSTPHRGRVRNHIANTVHKAMLEMALHARR